MSFPRYPKYKPSGVEWLGDVPEHWEAWKLTHALEKIGSGTTPKTDNRAYYDEGTHPWVNTGDLNDGDLIDCEKRITSLALSDHTTLRTYPVGSVVIAMYGATIGKLAILGFEATVNQACCVFAGESKLESKFLFYWLLGFRQQIISLASGGGQPNVNQDILRTLRIACPDLPEQTAIAEFLDRETGKIDGLVAEQRRLMELLKEKRQAVISHAVTKGLNPHAPMKPSGIEWLGDVPVGWTVKRFQRCVYVAEGQVDPTDGNFANMSLIAPNHIESGTGRLLGLETSADQGAESGKYLCKTGDVVYSKIRPALRKVCIAPEDCLCSADMYPLRPHSGLTPTFLFWLILSEQFSALAELESQRVAMPKINRESLKAVMLAVPPVEEQNTINAFIEAETVKFDALTAEAQRAIDLLQERRTALISAAVTGQIDVRNQPSKGKP